MTDFEAIRQYRAASDFRDFLRNRRLPWIFETDPAIVAWSKERDKKRIEQLEQTMRQAEEAIARLPRDEWREAIIQRYFLQRDHMAAAEAMNYSESSVKRFEYAAIEYLSQTEGR